MLLAFAPVGPEFRVNSTTSNDQTGPAIATDGTGNYVIVWQSSGQDGSGLGVYAQLYNTAGVVQGAEFRVNTTTLNDQSLPAVAMDNAGDFVVTWSGNGTGDVAGVFAQRYNPAGVKQGGQFRVNTTTLNDQSLPAVAMDQTGDFIVAWQSYGQDGSGLGAYAQRYNATGVKQGVEFRVNTYTSGNQYEPSVAMDTAGDFVVAWQSFYQDGSSWGVYAQRYNATGVKQGGEFGVNTYIAGNQSSASVGMDAAGDFVVAWHSGGGQDGSGYGIFAQHYNAAGVAQGGEFGVNTYTTGNQFYASVGMNAAGDSVFAWTSDGQDGSGLGVYGQRYDSAGVKQGAEFRVNTTTPNDQGSSSLPPNTTVAMDSAGDFVMTWPSAGQDGSGLGVYAQRYQQFSNPASVGDFVWQDTNANGVQDPGEPGIDGVTVNLFNEFGSIAGTTTTAGGGLYRFDSLRPEDSYYLQFVPIFGLPFTSQDQGADDAIDSDVDPTSGGTALFTLTADQVDWSKDAGLIAGSVGDFVWNDDNGNGLQDPAEPGIDGVTAKLFTASGSLVETTTTAGGGFYRFDRLRAGDSYYLQFVAPPGLLFASRDQGSDDSQDSDVDPANGRTAPFTLATGQMDLGKDAGFITASSVGDFVWNDSNANGIQNAGEAGIDGVTVQLFTGAGSAVATTTTAGGGLYRFDILRPGDSYYLQVAAPAGFYFTNQDQGADDALDSDVDANGFTAPFTLGLHQVDLGKDAGLIPGANIAGVKFHDLNGNGVRDTSESGLPGWVIYNDANGNGQLDAGESSVVTGGDGAYTFGGLRPGIYNIAEVPQDHWMPTTAIPVVVALALGQNATGTDLGSRTDLPNTLASPSGPEFRVNTYTLLDQANSAVAMDGVGNFVVTWSGYGTGDSDGVFAQRYNSAGLTQGAEFRVNGYTTGRQSKPSVATDAAGNFTVAWQSLGQDGSGYGVYAQRYNAAGVAQGGEFRVNTYTAFAQFEPSVAMDAAGNFTVAWASDGQDGSYLGLYAQRYNAAGVKQGGEFQVNTYTTDNQGEPSVAMDSAGNFIVTWDSLGQDGSSFGVYARRYNAAGVAQDGEFRVNTHTDSYQWLPSVAMDADGNFTVAWQSYGQDGSGEGVYAQRYNAAGVEQGGEFRVNTYTSSDQEAPSVAMDPAGNFVVAWTSHGQDGDYWGSYAQRYNAAGVAQGAEFRVNTYTTERQRYPSVAMDADGDFIVAWESTDQDGSGDGIYAQRYAVSGPLQIIGTSGSDSIYVKSDPTNINIWINHDPASDPADVTRTVASITSISVNGGLGDDTLTLDFTNGNPIPTGGLTLDGSAGNDLLKVIGTAGPDTISVNGTQVLFGGTVIAYSAIEQITINTNAGDDTVTIDFATGNPIPAGGLNIDGGTGADTLNFIGPGSGNINLTGGSFTIPADPNGISLAISGTAAVNFATTAHLSSLTLTDTAKASLAPGGSNLLRSSGLSIAAGASLDLGDGDLILNATAASRAALLATVSDLIKSARNGGNWNGPGLTSSAAAAQPNHLTGLGVILNDQGNGAVIVPAFDSQPVDSNAILVKYTYNGDSDLTGKIDADDYFRIDFSFATRPANAGYRGGDLDFTGAVDADDYFLIDRAFAGQTSPLDGGGLNRATAALPSAASTTHPAKPQSAHSLRRHHRRLRMFG
jgi:hypothetical protein